MDCVGDELQADCEEHLETDLSKEETIPNEGTDNIENHADEDPKWWDSESQNLLDSQQLVEALSLCDDLLQSQSPNRDGKSGEHNDRPSFSVYAQLGPEHLKKDLEDCQNLVVDPAIANIELETPSEFRLSQLVFLCSLWFLHYISVVFFSIFISCNWKILYTKSSTSLNFSHGTIKPL